MGENDDDPELSLEPGDLILRGEGKVVGIHTKRFKRTPTQPPPTPEPKRHTRKEAAKKIARKVVDSSAKLTEEEALAKAAELASEAAHRMSLGTPKRQRGFGLGSILQAIVDRKKKTDTDTG